MKNSGNRDHSDLMREGLPVSEGSIFKLTAHRSWNEYVNKHPKGSVFHTREMFRVFEDTPGHSPLWIGARNADGEIVAILCAVKVTTISGMLSRFTSRSIMFAEPICDDTDEGVLALAKLVEFHDKQWGKQILFTEVRPMKSPGAETAALESAQYKQMDYCNYINDLSDGHHVLASRIKKTMRKVRTAKRRGLVIEKGNNGALLARAYRQIETSYAHSQVPVAPVEILEAAVRHLPPEVLQIRVGHVGGVDVAAAVGMVYKNRYFAWYNGTTRPRGIAGVATLVWDEIETACRMGLSEYDFGGAGWPDEDFGPRQFKSRFGGTLVNHSRYRKIGSQIKLALAEKGYGILRRFLSSVKNKQDSRNEGKFFEFEASERET